MPEILRSTTSNRILSRLPRDQFSLLEPYLQAVDLPVRKQLELEKKRVDSAYFIESGFASVVAGSDGRPIEVGIIGREGMTGLSVVLGADRAPHQTFIQLPGKGLRISASKLRQAIDQSVPLHRSLLRHAHSFHVQATQTALANGRSKIEERLARWLLMADDRIDGDDMPLTHEFLAMMLGVRRSGVTVAVQELERQGLITHRRSIIRILNRKDLENAANGTYTPADHD